MSTPKYRKQPVADPTHQERLRWVLAAMTGQISVAAAARQLALSRVQMHNLINRLATAMMEAVTPNPPGRPARSGREIELQETNERLERENQRLRQRVETVDRLLGVASQMMRGRLQAQGRTTKRSRGSSAGSKNDSEEPGGCREWLGGVMAMRACGLTAPVAAAIVGVSAPTIRRWESHIRGGRPPRAKRGGGPRPRCTPSAADAVAERVRSLHGLIGANALRSVEISRREAARIKRQTLTAIERERKACSGRVVVSGPGTMRGFDAMCVGTSFALIAADAAIPFRTTVTAAARYDASQVLTALAIDFHTHGAPLVLRLDRASCQRVPEVDDLLDHYGVLRLHGPPHHPRYYGQLERQNREHRHWLTRAAPGPLQPTLDQMCFALNELWPRPSLRGCTAGQLWRQRATITLDRTALREEVIERSQRIARSLNTTDRGALTDLAWRLSVEHALTIRGLLTITTAGRC